MNVIGIDVASEVSSVCIIGRNGRVMREERIPTRIGEIRRIIKEVPQPRQVVIEEGTQATWLWSELHQLCDDFLVCDPRQNQELSGQFKSDKNDARNLGLRARGNLLKRVWHSGPEFQSMREAVRTYQTLTEESTRLKNQIRAVFRGRGIKVGKKAYELKSRRVAVRQLKLAIQRERVLQLGAVLDEVAVQRSAALKSLVKYARKNRMYKALRAIDGIGPIFAAMFIAEVGDPHRFRTKAQLWSYAGLAVMTYDTAEFKIQHGQAVRKARPPRTRGLVRSYNRNLKYVFKQSAMTLSRSKWSAPYQVLLKNSKNANNALLTLARKLAAVMLYIAKTEAKYDVVKVFNAQ
jgi:transposase